MPATPSPRQIVWAKTRVDHSCFLLYDRLAVHQDHDLFRRLGEDLHRMLLCTPEGVAALSAVRDLRYASVRVEVYDSEPATALEWADDAMECDLSLKESLELQLQSIMGDNAATVYLGRRGAWRLRAHRRPAQQADHRDMQEEWLFQLWPLPEPPGDPAEAAAIEALLRRAVPRNG